MVPDRHGDTRGIAGSAGTTATVISGLGAMLGAGLFAGLAPATGLVGRWLPVALVIAAVPAAMSCCSTGDQAGVFPGPGGGYRYTREQLGRWPGRIAGGLYLAGRAAAAAALAGCFGAYLDPNRPALPALALLAAVLVADALKLRPAPALVRTLTVIVLVVLALVVVACFAIPAPPPTGVPVPAGTPGLDDPTGLLPAAGVLFFAFLGFEQVTTGSGAYRRPRIAIPVLVAVALGTYLVVAFAVLHQLGPTRLAVSAVPLRDALDAADAAPLDPVVTVAALVATALGLLLVVGGGRRTADAMAAGGDLPGVAVGARVFVVVGGAVGVLVAGPADAIELAATCALFYYAFANASARLLSREERAWPARTACFGLGVTVLIGMAMPPVDLAIALGVTVVSGLAGTVVSTVRWLRR
ncbi:MAG TPA: amino acid permease [Pseudonocardiaceae bacterium]|jgi:APA family basic amino acid/polyamine antiporter|nr:amino acid permease [Pseudonocardiaceae bacterium]